jgi:hypothetical protein
MMNTRMPFHSRAGQAHGLHGLHVMAGGAFLPSRLDAPLLRHPQLTTGRLSLCRCACSRINHNLLPIAFIHCRLISSLTLTNMLSLPLAKLSSTQDAHPDDPKLTWKHESHDLHFVIDSYQAGGSALQLLKVVQGTRVRVRAAACSPII